jgi:hypothetical protein
MNIAAVDRISTSMHCIMPNSTTKYISKIHILAMARHAGLAIQDDNKFFLNDLASEKELLTFARLIERSIRLTLDTPVEVD